MSKPSEMTDAQAVLAARDKLRVGGQELAEVAPSARVVRLDDPDASGVAVEAWVYLMDDPDA